MPFSGAAVARKAEKRCTNCMFWAPWYGECVSPSHRCDLLLYACPCMAAWLTFITLLAVVCQVFGCAGDLSGAGGCFFSPPAVGIIRTDRTVCVRLSWSRFGRYTSKISDHKRSTNIVHIEWFTVTSYELETLNAPSLEFRVHNKYTKDNCDTKTWCVE